MPFADLPTGIRLYYEEHGSGEPLILIMGTSADHGYWSAQVPAYAERYRTIVFDSRGTGQSSRPDDPNTCTPGALADDVDGLLEHLGVARAHVSGLSLGAAVGQELALRNPDRVATLQLHGAWAQPDPAFVYGIECMKYPLLLGDLEAFTRVAFSWIFTAEFLNHDPSRTAMLAAVQDNPHPASVSGILGHIHADLIHDTAERLHAIRCPTLVTAGERDIQVPARLGRAVHRAIPGSQFLLFVGPGSSHLSCVERAAQFNAVTLDWLGQNALQERR